MARKLRVEHRPQSFIELTRKLRSIVVAWLFFVSIPESSAFTVTGQLTNGDYTINLHGGKYGAREWVVLQGSSVRSYKTELVLGKWRTFLPIRTIHLVVCLVLIVALVVMCTVLREWRKPVSGGAKVDENRRFEIPVASV